jgi:gamma-glutamyl-gamma-aminobutyrate hydrolase PuuD
MSSKREPVKKRPRVYIVGGGFAYIKMFYELGYDGATNVEGADIVCFTGGEDVNPELYGEPTMPKTFWNRMRDDQETAIYHRALELGLPMVGICRGGQFLNVMNNGSLWQHVTGHTVQHLARIEVPPFRENGARRTINVTSTHHQMMRPTEEAFILMTALEAKERHGPAISKIGGPFQDDPDIEVVWYEETNCLCFQPHPEHVNASPDLVEFFEECIENFVVPNIPSETTRAIVGHIPPRIKEEEKKTTKSRTKKETLTVPKTKKEKA